jgi:hypothetical protein
VIKKFEEVKKKNRPISTLQLLDGKFNTGKIIATQNPVCLLRKVCVYREFEALGFGPGSLRPGMYPNPFQRQPPF